MIPMPRITRTLASALLTLSLASPALAETVTPLTPAQIAPAITRTDSIPGANELVHDAASGLLYVASVPDFAEGTPGYIHILDATDLRPLRQIQSGRLPFALALDHSTGRLYAGNTLEGSLSVIDAKGGQLLQVIQLGQPMGEGFEHTRMIALDEGRGLGFVTSPGEKGVIWVVDTKDGKLLHRIDQGLWTAGAAHDPQAGRFYASGGGMAEIAVIDAESGGLTGTISTGDTVEPGEAASKHFFVNLAIDPATQRLFAADASTGSLYVIDIAAGKPVATVPVGLGVLDVAFNPTRSEIYVSWRGVTREAPEGQGGVAVIDATDYRVKAQIPLATHPNSLEVSADGSVLFVTVKAPHEESHPDYRKGALDGVVRLDLAKLAGLSD
ncbi:YncE family protein [Xinfangfangia sp. D13-10-4-6]|uniref:YncE family protein n=1 Tax=Pseudogemmobacter hezensis TaxID=2737662 RepID=UPI0015554905|nr:YncE family protein [Pseudogemmobacter hezensis]NPD14905.1 YncE family protein [Pseudogemmobacter hezensis]